MAICMESVDIFQLTASQGGWPVIGSIFVRNCIFQLTASQGGWQVLTSTGCHSEIFQLTASQGGWQYHYCSHIRGWYISTHSLTRRLTGYRTFYKYTLLRFQLTASQGGWLIQVLVIIWEKHFNSQPHKEADRQLPEVSWKQKHFNSQPHKEADVRNIATGITDTLFQLTASQGGWRLKL